MYARFVCNITLIWSSKFENFNITARFSRRDYTHLQANQEHFK